MKKTKLKTYNPKTIEQKWQKIWKNNKTFQVDLNKSKKPYFNLMMFPYPSAEGLHVGNMYAFTGSDIWGRYVRMQGNDVFEPIGLDGFGIHSENYAIKVKKHPAEQAKVSQANYYRQLSAIGNQFSWDNKLETYDPDYYKWTQWLFITLFKAGLAYRKKAPVNWCPSCKTVLADEQVILGKCERCEAEVLEKKLEQWFFKITTYADRLLNNLKKIDWTDKVKIAQKNWIGKKIGINLVYDIEKTSEKVVCFTTRPDTNFGATFVVVAPEHPLLNKLKPHMLATSKKQIDEYINNTKKITKEERVSQGREKTGVFTGLYAVNQLTDFRMPIWVSDFVLKEFGSGAVVGVPGHDLRDFEFAKKYKLKIIRVVVGPDKDESNITKPEQVQEEVGFMVNSQFLNGMDIHKATLKIMDYIEKKGWGKKTTTYHLRDWLISRQRYWGPPIPMINCKKCGWQPVLETDLPVKLPFVKDYQPKGADRGPLSEAKDWVNTTCPKCKGKAERETDVSDTFLDSAWYFLRYPSVKNKNNPWDVKLTKKWLPVDMYIGGAEHSVLHLLYSRFITMVLKDLGYLDFEEPFTCFRAHGLIIKDGSKMSKSKGNIVNPDEYIEKYGADALRCYLMFVGPYSAGGDFRDTGMIGMYKFLKRVYMLCQKHLNKEKDLKPSQKEIYWQHKTIQRVESGIQRLKYNTSIAALMEYINFLKEQKKVSKNSLQNLVLLLAPFAPYLTQELWELSGEKGTVHLKAWPKYEKEFSKDKQVEIVIQINGKIRDKINVSAATAKLTNELLKLAKDQEKIKKHLKDKKIKKEFAVRGKLINFVTD
ncbi:leucine--tRNA ligase [Patescibacteria group bacterium]